MFLSLGLANLDPFSLYGMTLGNTMTHTQMKSSFYEYLSVEMKRELLTKLFTLYLEKTQLSTARDSLQFKLKTFINFSLSKSYSQRYSDEQIIQLLDCAWEAQKLLWDLEKPH